MIRTLDVIHHEHSSGRTYEAVVKALYEETGSVEEGSATVIGGAASREAFTEILKAREGASGFMRFMVIDHADWLSRFYDRPAKGLLVILGNPLVAIMMLANDVQVGLNVPTRIYICRQTAIERGWHKTCHHRLCPTSLQRRGRLLSSSTQSLSNWRPRSVGSRPPRE